MFRNARLTFLVLAVLVVSLAGMTQAQDVYDYEIHITNITANQIFAPPVVAVHARTTSLFDPGAPASDSLALLAEDGDGSALIEDLMMDSQVSHIAAGDGVLMPGETLVLSISGVATPSRLSAVGMLVSTNDGFFGLDSAQITGRLLQQDLFAEVWDAGSENNSEACAFIPGPPCGNGGVRDLDGAEGFVHSHSGIHGIGDLEPASWDWRGPAARVQIVRVSD